MHAIHTSRADPTYLLIEETVADPKIEAYENFTPNESFAIPQRHFRKFEDLLSNLMEPRIVNFSKFLSKHRHIPANLKRALASHFATIDTKYKSPETQKIRQYLSIVFNVLDKKLRGQARLTEEVCEKLVQSFNDGCEFNQMLSIRALIIEIFEKDPDFISYTNALSSEDFYISIALQNYQTDLITEEIHQKAPRHLQHFLDTNDNFTLIFNGLEQMFNRGNLQKKVSQALPFIHLPRVQSLEGFILKLGSVNHLNPGKFDPYSKGLETLFLIAGEEAKQVEIKSLGADIIEESVEMQFVVKKILGFCDESFNALYYNDSDISKEIASCVQKRYNPAEYLITNLSSRYPPASLRSLHAKIGSWFREIGLDPTLEENNFLLDPASELFDLWFTPKAVLYFMEKSGVAREIKDIRQYC